MSGKNSKKLFSKIKFALFNVKQNDNCSKKWTDNFPKIELIVTEKIQIHPDEKLTNQHFFTRYVQTNYLKLNSMTQFKK